MCRISKDGYIMEDGTKIPFQKLNLGDISPKHIEQLNKSTPSIYDILLLRNDMYNMKDEIVNDVRQIVESHTIGCPINKDKVEHMIENKLTSYPKEKLKSTSKILSYVSVIFSFIWSAILFIAWLTGKLFQ